MSSNNPISNNLPKLGQRVRIQDGNKEVNAIFLAYLNADDNYYLTDSGRLIPQEEISHFTEAVEMN
ncbi:hypothetical protein IM792_19410 [Mucilaginibacter sp. JRF]|uniref:hypothetical protein n=1 Tax=Mucilaginibacter sp. JRF TaxID=2780088 RepID=UPI00187F4A9D|nr:hypothetical protein [Mucilaginibacter sp. JRF]MBE9586626.1 hypothetical protein [Mucilaginibacter sp. JRF]